MLLSFSLHLASERPPWAPPVDVSADVNVDGDADVNLVDDDDEAGDVEADDDDDDANADGESMAGNADAGVVKGNQEECAIEEDTSASPSPSNLLEHLLRTKLLPNLASHLGERAVAMATAV
eukprot:6205155-Pleurochrysis_carterae.AAC.1